MCFLPPFPQPNSQFKLCSTSTMLVKIPFLFHSLKWKSQLAFWYSLLFYTLHHQQHFMDSCAVPITPLKNLSIGWISQPNQMKDNDIHTCCVPSCIISGSWCLNLKTVFSTSFLNSVWIHPRSRESRSGNSRE